MEKNNRRQVCVWIVKYVWSALIGLFVAFVHNIYLQDDIAPSILLAGIVIATYLYARHYLKHTISEAAIRDMVDSYESNPKLSVLFKNVTKEKLYEDFYSTINIWLKAGRGQINKDTHWLAKGILIAYMNRELKM
jgi:hypothetical protein